MLKIQLRPQFDQARDRFISPEYIWMNNTGKPWPVSMGEEQDVIKVECFGEELQNAAIKALGNSQDIINEQGVLIYRTWINQDARYVSAQLRAIYKF